MKPTIGTLENGKTLDIDVKRLLLTRLLVQASSGGGKSWLLRRVLEQTASHVQQIILDIEGEFVTLREKFDYVICAPQGADAIATPQTAAILARRLRETRVSAIIDLYELKMHDRRRFVRLFLEELLETPKSMWHPCLVVVDEAHLFCPEKDQAESMAAVIDLATRGRKRGLCALLATQRLAKLHKDTAAELKNKLIGSTVLDTDVSRAAGDLGITLKDATPILRNLDAGEFYCFGPALSKEVVKVRVGSVTTTHPEPGAGAVTKPPEPSAKIRAMLAKLTDLPKEAEQEARTLADLKSENATLKRELTIAKKAQPPSTTTINTIEKPVVGMKALAGMKESEGKLRKMVTSINDSHAGIGVCAQILQQSVDELGEQIKRVLNSTEGQRPTAIAAGTPQSRLLSVRTESPPRQGGGNGAAPAEFDGPQLRILDALMELHAIGIQRPPRAQVMLFAGYTHPSSKGFANSLGALKSGGFVEYPDRGSIALTEHAFGHGLATRISAPTSNYEVHQRIIALLGGTANKILTPLLDNYPDPVYREALMTAAGYGHASSKGFANTLGRLRSLGLVDYPTSKQVCATKLLFPLGA